MSLRFALLLKLSQMMQPKYRIKKLCHIKAGNCNGLENVHLSNLLEHPSILPFYIGPFVTPNLTAIRDTKTRPTATHLHQAFTNHTISLRGK